jgi:hypothetical protein
MTDKFLAICTAFLAKLPAISLDEIKLKGSQQLLHFSKLPDNLHLPKDPQNVIEYKEWIILVESFLNATGSTLAIFKAKKWSWEIKMTPSILSAYLKRTGVLNDAILTGHDLQLMHHNCINENLDLSSRNYKIRQSEVYLFSFFIKVAEMVPVLYQTIQQIELNNVTAVIQDIDEFYIVLPDPEIYLRGLMVSTIRVAVHWHMRILQAVIAVAAKNSALVGQSVSEELMKFLCYLGTQS